MKLERFPIGSWNYVSLDQVDAHGVKDWGDAGITLTMSPDFDLQGDQIPRLHALLDAAQAAGIRLILSHRPSYWPGLTKHGEAAYRASFAAAVKEFGQHPAVFGFHVGDEPDRPDFADACRATRLQKELAPHLSPFLNLLPWHQGCEPRVGYASWATYLDDFVTRSGVEFLCYDCYSQMNPGTEGFDMYFRNLREYQEAGARHGIPYWTTLLSVGHFRYRCPREDDLRWQLNTALAHGAKGILYFFFYMRQPHDNYRVAPIDEHWERTESYEWLSRVNRTFLKSTAPLFQALTLRRVSHVGTAWGGVAAFDGSGLVARARSHQNTPLIVSEFRHTNGNDYVAMVNNSQTDSTYGELWVGGRGVKLFKAGWQGAEALASGVSGEDYARVQHWLAPGQMELYRVARG